MVRFCQKFIPKYVIKKEKSAMFISSLPPVHLEELLKSIIEHPIVDAVRYNTGVRSAYNPYETISRILALTVPLNKPLYIDLKGKQLRAIEWGIVPDSPVILNHKITVELPAEIHMRGDARGIVRKINNGNELYVDCKEGLVGKGQSINILGKNLKIEGGLLDLDHQYIRAMLDLGLMRFMLSFVENKDDVRELQEAIVRHSRGTVSVDECEIVFKIESQAGMDFVRNELTEKHFSEGSAYRLMAARDDLQIHIGVDQMPAATRDIVRKDPRSICASRLLMGLEDGGVTEADKSDVEHMRTLGYKHFMLSDGISREHSVEALKFWQEYCASRPFEK